MYGNNESVRRETQSECRRTRGPNSNASFSPEAGGADRWIYDRGCRREHVKRQEMEKQIEEESQSGSEVLIVKLAFYNAKIRRDSFEIQRSASRRHAASKLVYGRQYWEDLGGANKNAMTEGSSKLQ